MTEALKVPERVDVRKHTRRAWVRDPQAAQPTLFGERPLTAGAPSQPVEGAARKRRGQAQAAGRHREELALARAIAVEVAAGRPDRCCTADDVGRALEAKGVRLGNFMGSVFRGRSWVRTGQMVQSGRPDAHSRLVSVWHLQEGG